MPSFIARLPVWVLVVGGLLLGWLAYRYWKYRKATAYAPKIARGADIDFTSLRDNPKLGKS